MSEHRLPRRAHPKAYRIHLTADPDKPTFSGRVEIDVTLEDPAKVIEMHIRGLRVAEVHLDGEAIESAVQGDRLRLHGSFAPGTATLHIAYEGDIRHDMAGLYLSKDGERACLATQCEATDARSIVPCFDEPAYKATWQWTITAPEGLTVLANGPVEATETEAGQTTHTFAATAPMSSYLIACCIGDFAAAAPLDARGHAMRVWTMRGQEHHGDHGNDLAARMLPWYEDYFGQDYAFGKYDQIAVPSFAFGAMENAGLVLFRPSLLLLDEATASWDDRRHVALVVAHEFAHMWFGNLVTMAWWDDLWLNEAFAEWIAHKCADAMDPGLEVWTPFRQRAAGALSTDALSSTHAIYHPVKTPEEAQEMFDAITYGKGSAVMRMLEAYLGKAAFQQGLQTYMAEFRFANARGEDLWRHLGAASGEDVAGIMGDWVNQPGHPTVSVSRADGRLQLRQARTRSSPGADVDATTWRIPLVIRFADDAGIHSHRVLLTDAAADLELPLTGALRWVWANADDGGFYRVALDDDLFHGALKHVADLSPPERVGMLRDLWVQVRSGDCEMTSFLEALDAMLGDTDYEVVEFQQGVLRLLDGLLQGHPEQADYRQWVGKRMRPCWDDDAAGEPVKQRRAAALRALGMAQDAHAVEAARSIGAREREGERVDPQLATAAVQAEALNGDEATLDVFLATYDKRRNAEASPQDVERYLYALASFREAGCVDRILGLLRSSDVPAQAAGPLLRAMLASAHAGRAAWEYLQDDWAALEGRLGDAWVGIVVEACGELPVELEQDIVTFWDTHLGGRAAQSYARAKERLADRKELEARIVPPLRAWAAL